MKHLELRGQTTNSIAATATIKTTETQQYEKNLMSVGSKIWKLLEISICQFDFLRYSGDV
jgi:hypothetical protein